MLILTDTGSWLLLTLTRKEVFVTSVTRSVMFSLLLLLLPVLQAVTAGDGDTDGALALLILAKTRPSV